MPRLKRQSGREIAASLQRFGFAIHSQWGSHLKLRRVGDRGERETLTILNHKSLDTGTCHAIYRQACRFVTPEALRPFFYCD